MSDSAALFRYVYTAFGAFLTISVRLIVCERHYR